MFSRRARLSTGRFETALRHGVRRSSAHFSVMIPTHEKGKAVVVSKKTTRLSVDRHRLKRRVLAVLTSLSIPSGLIVFPKGSALKLTPEAMRTELKTLLSKR